MQIISKRISFSSCLLIFMAASMPLAADATELLLSTPKDGRVDINIDKQNVIAKDNKKNIIYDVSEPVSQHLTRADDIRLVGGVNDPKALLFILMTREPSRPKAMGRGYCGAGHEDYLLLVEIHEKRLLLRDQLLLQSCLKSISIFIDQGDDHPSNGLMHETDDSYSYRLVDDDAGKKRMLTVGAKHFKATLVQIPTQ